MSKHTVWSQSSPPGWTESTVKSAFTWRKRFRAMVALMRTWSASRKETMSHVTTTVPLSKMQSTHSLSVLGGAWKGRLSVGQWAHNSLLTRWGQQRGPVEIASGPALAALRLVRTWLSASTGGGIFLFLPWFARLVSLPNGCVAADGSPGRTDDGRVVRDFKLEPNAREV